MSTLKPELLAPAGDMESLDYALAYGANALYLGAKEFGMRSSSENFTFEQLCTAAEKAHRRGALVYLTLNTLPTNDEITRLPETIRRARDAGVDAFIVADLGVLALAKQNAPDVEVHFSTQAGICNYEAARAAYTLGAGRVVLAREMSLDEIAEIRQKTPQGLALEVFVHGAMCMSVSGRCLISSYLTGRSANRGSCAQSCRWKYSLLEEKRPGEAYLMGEGDGGSYILSADDLCTAPILDKILKAGATSLKIEGRSKSFYYTASVTAAYRAALDAAQLALESKTPYIIPAFTKEELNKTSHRPYSTGFFLGKEGATQSPREGGYIRDWQLIGTVQRQDGDALVCQQRGKFTLGEELELLQPGGRVMRYIPAWILNENKEPINATPHTKMEFRIPAPDGALFEEKTILRKRMKAMEPD